MEEVTLSDLYFKKNTDLGGPMIGRVHGGRLARKLSIVLRRLSVARSGWCYGGDGERWAEMKTQS